jgi:DNA helicase-2/ATP-dependent DNA helicase PcrA
LEELRPELLLAEDTKPMEAELAAHPEARFAPPELHGAAVNDAAFIRELFLRNGLSVTALNNYLDCPWRYFYTNLLRIPKAKEPVQLYGTAVHEALRDFFANMGEGMPSKEFLLQAFTKYLGEQPLVASEHANALARGKAALAGYWERYHRTWRTNVLTEFNITGVFLTPDIRLTGKIDKLEFLGSGAEVNVVDYKTGRPKSRRDIEGETASSRGDIKRQLVFYNLLLNLHEDRKYRMVSGEIDFVQPDEKGRYHMESFTVTPEEISELEALAKRVAGEILSLAFWDRRCEKKDCEFCALREMMS